MTRSKRMQPAQRVAKGREQDAMRQLGQAQQKLAEQQARLDELCSYREQYSRQFESSSGAGLGATQLRDYRVFLDRLNEAIRQQEAVVADCMSHLGNVRDHWVATRSHSQAIEKVVGGFLRDERKQQEKKDQREQDEHAQRKHRK